MKIVKGLEVITKEYLPCKDDYGISIYKGVCIHWDEDYDARILVFIDSLSTAQRESLIIAQERKGSLNLVWRNEIPNDYKEDESFEVGTKDGGYDVWNIFTSVKIDASKNPFPKKEGHTREPLKTLFIGAIPGRVFDRGCTKCGELPSADAKCQECGEDYFLGTEPYLYSEDDRLYYGEVEGPSIYKCMCICGNDTFTCEEEVYCSACQNFLDNE